ncbi:MAG: prepilin-type N-terminal cleavage/methylation domain-containing protein [Desulfosporosinus sp.]
MNYFKRDNGFTLIEVLAVLIIIGVLGAIAVPKLLSSTVSARQKADVATAHEVKTALDRYQVENGTYPTDLTGSGGVVSSASFIPKYISKLDKSTTQQNAANEKKGFGVVSVPADAADPMKMTIPDTVTNTIMIYLNSNGLAAEVRVYDEGLAEVLWSSAD